MDEMRIGISLVLVSCAPAGSPPPEKPIQPIADVADKPMPHVSREDACEKGQTECIAAFVADCQGGDGEACFEMKNRFILSEATPPLSETQRRELRCVVDPRLCTARTECDHGDAAACVDYGQHEMAFGPGARDFRIVTAAFSKACELKNASGCRWLGFLYERGPEGMSDMREEHVPFDKKEALRLYREACKGGDQRGCEMGAELGRH